MASLACTNLTNYYSTAHWTAGSAGLKAALHEIISPHTVVTYNDAWAALRDLDASPADPSRVRLICVALASESGQRHHCRALSDANSV